ncbi:uncharacterized protein LOC144357143 [Saccoglossus kowalevskii]
MATKISIMQAVSDSPPKRVYSGRTLYKYANRVNASRKVRSKRPTNRNVETSSNSKKNHSERLRPSGDWMNLNDVNDCHCMKCRPDLHVLYMEVESRRQRRTCRLPQLPVN